MVLIIGDQKPSNAIYRIVGNDLPIRDRHGDRLRCCEFILKNEPKLFDCDRHWILNKFYNKRYEIKFIELLDDYKQSYLRLEFNLQEYKKQTTYLNKLLYSINPNIARNSAILSGRDHYDFTFVLDGECLFTEFQWNAVRNSLNKSILYPILKMHRRTFTNWEKETPQEQQEPQIGFNCIASIMFNEQVEFGNDDKNTLLREIGLQRRTYAVSKESKARYVGEVIHVSTDRPLNLNDRIKTRTIGLQRFIHDIDSCLML